MNSFFSVQITGPGLALMALVPVVLALFFWVIGRVVPPAVRPAGRPAGLGGLLCAVLLILSVKAALSLFELGREAGEAAKVLAVSIDFAGPVLKSMIPAIVNALAILLALFLLSFGRSRATLYASILCVWIAGPASDGLKAVILGIPYNMSSGFYGVSFFTILVTLYLLFSERAANTYGLHGAARAADSALPKA